MRRPAAAVVLACASLPLVLGSAAGASTSALASPQGRYLTPFREDGARYASATNTFSGGTRAGVATDANGCVTAPARTGAPQGNPRVYDCLPAGASIVNLPDGTVLFWNALEGEEQITGTNTLLTDGGRLTVNDESRVLTLRSTGPAYATPGTQDGGARQTTNPDDLPLGPFSAQHYPYNNGDLFCSDQVLLGNGDVLTAGGTDYYTEPSVPVVDKGVVELEGVRNSRYFDVSARRWRSGPTMHYGRWYPSLVTLANGQVFVASGVSKLLKPVYPTRPTESGTNVTETETLTVGSKDPQWVVNPASASKSLPLFPRLHLLPDGHVYYDAAGQDFNPFGQSYDEATWETASSYDPATKTWTDLGVPGADPAYLAANPTALPFVGFRGSTFSAALTMRPASVRSGVPVYTSASYLTAGGVLGTSPGSYVAVANSRITTVDTAGGVDKTSTVGTGDLLTPRWYGTATPLPNGQVFVSSGANVDEVAGPGSESPIRTDELFTPTVDAAGRYTGGAWAAAGSQARKRTYHNNAILLPDGSVLIGGHAPIATGYAQTLDTPDLPGRDGTNNHHDASFQVWLPPYFSDPARPTVTGVVAGLRALTVSTPDAARIATVVLMRNTAQTHLVDGDARTVSLPVLSRTAGTVTVGLPATSAVLPNGPYVLFANASRSGNLSGRDAADLLPSRGVQLYVSGTSVPAVLVPGSGSGFEQGAARTAPRPVKRTQGTPSSRAQAPVVTSGPGTTGAGLDTLADGQRQHPWSLPLSRLLLAAVLPAVAGATLLRPRRRRA